MRPSSLEEAGRALKGATAPWHACSLNGQNAWLGPDNLPLSQVAVRWPAGFQDEQTDESGFAHLIEHALFRGSPSRVGRENALLWAGGASNGRTNRQGTMFWSAAKYEDRELALANELQRCVEPVPASWVEHQAKVVRAELLYKSKGNVDGYARIRYAIERGGPWAEGSDGFVRDALTTGLAGLNRFVHRAYATLPAIAFSGYSALEVRRAFADSVDAISMRPRISGTLGGRAEPAITTGISAFGYAKLHILKDQLGIMERALVGAAARLTLADVPGAQLRLHLWGDSIVETTSPPFLIMMEATEDAAPKAQRYLRSLDERSVRSIVHSALPTAVAKIHRLAMQLQGPWAAQTWSGLLERGEDGLFRPPKHVFSEASDVVALAGDVVFAAVRASGGE